ncbi:MAG: proline dehydrogenase [Chitinophagaceae bacterium]|nr:proline dehydrogenase [Chitinophagaceae bacterium]
MSTLFNDTKIAFRSKSNKQLLQAYWLFRLMGFPELTKIGTYFIKTALKAPLGLKKVIKSTLYQQFCGGETLPECEKTMAELARFGVFSIPDYVAEGQETQQAFDQAMFQVLETIQMASRNSSIGFAVFKVTALGSAQVLSRKQAGLLLSDAEEQEWELIQKRVHHIISSAVEAGVRVMIDAEESWIQDVIDELAYSAMFLYNIDKAWVFNTCQMYRSDMPARLKKLKAMAVEKHFIPGVKLVRGAYLEKENKRAAQLNYQSPIWSTKKETDQAYDEALDYCFAQGIALCIGTHNEDSVETAIRLMKKNNVTSNNENYCFAQLFGMSDHITFNLAEQGYRAAKYLPFGPMKLSLPYLFRRANENKSVSGQSSRELELLKKELRRRKNS